MERLRKIIVKIIKFRITIIAILAVAMGLSGYHTVTKLSVDNSLGIWFLEDDPSYRAYIDYQQNFGSDEIFIAMLPVENAIGEAEVLSLKELHQSIESLPYVQTSYSLAKAKYPIYANNTLNFNGFYNSKRSEKDLKSLFSKLPNITSQLVTKDYKNQFFYIQLNPTSTVEEKRQVI
jgi:predicted RND superfamily exporter protein